MKKRKVDDGVFVGERLVPETYEERMAALLAMAEAQMAAPSTWLDDVRAEADSMLAYIREHDCPKKDIWRVEELQRELANYHLAGHPEYAAFRIGMTLQDARIRVGFESENLRRGRANIAALEDGHKTKTKKRSAADIRILAMFDKKASKQTGLPERAVCENTANELNRAYRSGDKELEKVLMHLKKNEFSADMVRARVQRRKKENG